MCSVHGRNVPRTYQMKAFVGTQKTATWSKLQSFGIESKVMGP